MKCTNLQLRIFQCLILFSIFGIQVNTEVNLHSAVLRGRVGGKGKKSAKMLFKKQLVILGKTLKFERR